MKVIHFHLYSKMYLDTSLFSNFFLILIHSYVFSPHENSAPGKQFRLGKPNSLVRTGFFELQALFELVGQWALKIRWIDFSRADLLWRFILSLAKSLEGRQNEREKISAAPATMFNYFFLLTLSLRTIFWTERWWCR